jgi:hypothetical protein
VVTGQCRSFNPKREKLNESDDPNRRGLCKQKEGLDGGDGAGGGGARAAGAGGGGLGGFGFTDLFSIGGPQSQFIWNSLQNIIQGGGGRYNPQVVAALEGKAKAAQQAAIEAGTRGVRREAARTGVARSPFLSRPIGDVRRAADVEFGQQVQQIQVDKATTDFQDRMAALNAAQNWLNSLRDYVAKLDVNQVQREQIAAQLKLGFANIDAQKALLAQKFGYDMQLLQTQLSANNVTLTLPNGQTVTVPGSIFSLLLAGLAA